MSAPGSVRIDAGLAGRGHALWLDFIARTDGMLPRPGNIRAPRDKCAVIIEPRRHPHLSYVVRNVMHFLDPSWGLCIVHGTENEQFVRDLVRGWGEVVLMNCGSVDLPGYRYADFRCRRSFWQQLPSETLLFFETDSILRRRGIDEFLDYDYVGAPWMTALMGDGSKGPVGNGGLSLRRRSAMLRIVEQHPRMPGTSEDRFFSHWLYRDGYRLPSLETAGMFSTETILQPDSLGMHKPWSYQFEGPLRQLLDTIRY